MAARLMLDWFSSNEALIQSALALSILGLSVQVGLRAGVFSMAGVGFWAFGGYTAALLITERGVPTIVAVGAGMLGAAALGFGLALILGRLRNLYLAMATFAFVLLVQVVAINWESLTGGPLGLLSIPVSVNNTGLVLVVAACAGVAFMLERGRPGRTLEVLRLDEQLARTAGINVLRWRVGAFVLSCALGALSGSMNALLFNTLSPDQAGFHLIVDALTVIVIGGTAAWYGPLLGATAVVWLPEVLRFTGEWRSVVQGAIVVVMVVYAPEGAVGLIRRIRRLAVGLRDRKVADPAPLAPTTEARS
jgi:branched-chain amino acid transport system permease protein